MNKTIFLGHSASTDELKLVQSSFSAFIIEQGCIGLPLEFCLGTNVVVLLEFLQCLVNLLDKGLCLIPFEGQDHKVFPLWSKFGAGLGEEAEQGCSSRGFEMKAA